MKVIVLEGLDGSGKTSLAKAVAESLKTYGINAKYVHFPDADSFMGSHIYDYLHGKMPVEFGKVNFNAQYMMYALDRYEFFMKYRKELENTVIICDRYTTSSMIFQSAQMYLQMIEMAKKAYKYAIEFRDITGDLPDGYDKDLIDFIEKEKITDPVDGYSRVYMSPISASFSKNNFAYEDEYHKHRIPEINWNLKNFIKFIKQFEYTMLGIPMPSKVYYIETNGSKKDSANEAASRMSTDERPSDSFEKDIKFQTLVCAAACNVALDEQWKNIYNMTGKFDEALNAILEDIINNFSFPVKYNIMYQNRKEKAE